MKRIATILAALLVAACASPAPPAAERSGFARELLARSESAPVRTAEPPRELPELRPVPARTEAERIDGLLVLPRERLDELRRIAADDDALADFLAEAPTRDELAALAYLRSPEVAAAREKLEAARTGWDQSADLADLVSLYRSFTEQTDPGRHAPGPIAPYPGVTALSGEVVDRTVAIAFQELRSAVVDAVARAEEAHAEAAHLETAIGIRTDDLAWNDARLENLRARLESGRASQAAFLTFSARIEELRTDLAVLRDRRAAVRARWNRLLRRPEDAPAVLPRDFAESPPLENDDADVSSNPDVVAAALAAERAGFAVRLAETMTLPRMDVGSARPGAGRAAFGVREAQVREMRAKARAAAEAATAVRDRAATRARAALVDAAAARARVHDGETSVVPLTEQALVTTRGAFEGGSAGYLDLVDAAERALASKLALANAKKELARARADVLRATGVHPEVKR